MMLSLVPRSLLLCGFAALPAAALAETQVPLDRTDPGLAAKAAERRPAPPAAAPRMPVTIETPAASSPAPAAAILAGAIRIDGAEHVPMPPLMQAISPFIGHQLSRASLQDLLTAVSGVARAQGFLFARSSIPPQTLAAGVLHVRLDEGRIDSIETPGDRGDAVRAVLSTLIGRPATKNALERRLMLAGDLPGVTIGKVRYELRGATGVLIVPVSHDAVSGRASIDNRGLSVLGPVRAQLSVNFNGLLGQRDELTVQALVTPAQPSELKVLFGRYAVTLGDSGTELAAYGSYARTRSGGVWRPYDAKGESFSAGTTLTQPLLRGRKVSLWLAAGLDTFSVEQWYTGELVRRDRLTTAGVSLNGYLPLAGGRLRAGGGVTQGLDVLGATARDNPLASRPDAGPHFTLFSAWANWTGAVTGPISAKLAMAAQASTRPLLAIEQITIGGPVFGRGYDYSERAGDEGVLGSAELRVKLLDRGHGLIRWAQLYTFGDAGYVANHDDSFGTGTLYSAGAGARLTLAHRFDLELEAAFPINAVRYQSGDRSPRLSFSVAKAF